MHMQDNSTPSHNVPPRVPGYSPISSLDATLRLRMKSDTAAREATKQWTAPSNRSFPPRRTAA
jgi:hypothetical protein